MALISLALSFIAAVAALLQTVNTNDLRLSEIRDVLRQIRDELGREQ